MTTRPEPATSSGDPPGGSEGRVEASRPSPAASGADPTGGSQGRVEAAGRLYWCELAWLGGDAAEAGVEIEVDDGRIAAVRSGVAAPASAAERLDGITIP